MRTRILLVALAMLGGSSLSSAQDCTDVTASSVFLGYGSGSKEFTDDQTKSTFAPLLACLKTWVEDGGERDGIPIEEWAKAHEPARVIYRAKAMELIDALVLLDVSATRGLGSWILSSVEKWPDPVKWNAWKTLADLNERQAVPLLRRAATREVGTGRAFAWEQLARLSPETAVSDLETLGRTQEEYGAIGFALLSVKSAAIIPALDRLILLDPGKANRYKSRISELQGF